MSNTSFILILIVLIFFSAFFSASETAFSSLNRIKIKNLANDDNLLAKETLKIVDNYPRFISTILVGNNLVNIIAATLATVFFTKLLREDGPMLSSIVMTILVIIFGEICPKRLARSNPEGFALKATNVIKIVMFILAPLTYIFNVIGDLSEKLFKVKKENDFDSDELVTMVEEAEEQGDMDKHEADLITNAIEFNDQDVADVYTPRVDVIFTSSSDSLDDIEKKFRESGYSRLPYYKNSIDNIIGFVHEKDFYQIFFKKSNKSIDEILQRVVYTNSNVKISKVLRLLQAAKSHMAVVVDEYGGTEGIITMEDILEELVGEIYDEHDEVVEYFKKLSNDEYIVDCDASIDDLFEFFNINNDENLSYNTVSGFVIDELDKIPAVGDKFIYKNLEIKVINASKKEVKEILVKVKKA